MIGTVEIEALAADSGCLKGWIRRALTLNRMQMYGAVSRARRGVKVIWLENRKTKAAELLNAVKPYGSEDSSA